MLFLTFLCLFPVIHGFRLQPVHPKDAQRSPVSPYIVNGTAADDGEWPWQGSLRRSTGSHTCGCVLVDPNFILTASHCVGDTGYTAMFGSNDLLADGTDGSQVVGIVTILRHPAYVGIGITPNGAYPYDYAILTPDQALVLNDRVKTISLTNDNNAVGKTCYITGWGRVEDGSALPSRLQESNVPVITDEVATSYWGNSYNNEVHISILDLQDYSGACNGDSGGPLVCLETDGVYTLYGLASWVYNGCLTTYPSTYARIFTMRTWICDNINNSSTAGCGV